MKLGKKSDAIIAFERAVENDDREGIALRELTLAKESEHDF